MKKMIFTITTGRSGTGFLAKLLQTLPPDQVFAGHEVPPLFDDWLSKAREDYNVYTKFLSLLKLPAIMEKEQPVYIETSHIFCKGFLEPLINLALYDIELKFIHLTRPHREVASSMYLLNDIPSRTKTGRRYYLETGPGNLIQVPDWDKLSDYQLCYWYCLEMEERARRYRIWLGNKIFTISLKGLKYEYKFRNMLTFLGLPDPVSWDLYRTLTHVKVNQKLGRKSGRNLPNNINDQEQDLIDILSNL